MVVQKSAFRRALKSLVRMLDPHARRPDLSEVELVGDGARLRLTCETERTRFSTSVACEGRFSGRVCAADLLEFVSPCPAAERAHAVEFSELPGGCVVIATEGSLIELPVSTSSSSARHVARDIEQPWQHVATWPGVEFVDGVAWVLRALGRDPSRPQLCNVLFEGRDCCATDGHRLHVAKLEADVVPGLLVDGTTLATFVEVVSASDEVTVARSGERLWLRAGAWSLETDEPRTPFPPHQQVIPREGDETFSVTADRVELQRAVARLISRRKREGVRLVVNGALTIERGTTSIVPRIVGTTHEGPNSVVGVDPAYLADALASGSDEVALRFGDGLSPIRCDLGHGRVGVVMPMRI